MSEQPEIVLRKLEPDDLPLLYQWENDADTWLDGDTHNPLSQADLREYIMRTTGDVFLDGQLRLMICPDVPDANSRAQSVEPIGCVDLYDVDIRNRKAAVAIYISPDYRGKGIAREALIKLKEYVANVLCFRLLYAFVRESNHASESLFCSAGFKRVATLPHWVNEGNIFVLQTEL